MKSTKKIGLKLLPAVFITLIYFGLSLACVSFPSTHSNHTVRITIKDLNRWLVGHEEKFTVENGLTAAQLMEVTRVCLLLGELQGLSLVQKSDVLHFAVFEAAVSIHDVIIKYKFNYSISRSGVLTMKISEVYEDIPDSYRVTVNEGNGHAYKAAVMRKFTEKLENIAEIVISRSFDFV